MRSAARRACARRATPARTATTRANNASCSRELDDVRRGRRTARFRCVLVLRRPRRDAPRRRGRVRGAHRPRAARRRRLRLRSAVPRRGRAAGPHHGRALVDEKNRISHRARALEALVRALDERYGTARIARPRGTGHAPTGCVAIRDRDASRVAARARLLAAADGVRGGRPRRRCGDRAGDAQRQRARAPARRHPVVAGGRAHPAAARRRRADAPGARRDRRQSARARGARARHRALPRPACDLRGGRGGGARARAAPVLVARDDTRAGGRVVRVGRVPRVRLRRAALHPALGRVDADAVPALAAAAAHGGDASRRRRRPGVPDAPDQRGAAARARRDVGGGGDLGREDRRRSRPS